jgi:hypothetical protein
VLIGHPKTPNNTVGIILPQSTESRFEEDLIFIKYNPVMSFVEAAFSFLY